MDKTKIEIIYRMLINRIELTNNALRIYGFSQDEIDELVAKKIIEAMQDGTYRLYQVDKLRKYGISLLQKGQNKDADICFKMCYQLAPTGKHICLQAMLAAINRHDYRILFEIYSNLEKVHPEKNAQDNMLYLYLLSVVTKVPEEYKERTRKIMPSELILPYTVGTKIENQIRIAISKNQFAYAHHLISERLTKEANYSVKFELLKSLCDEAADWTKRFKDKIFYLIQSEGYEQIISMLLEQQKQRRLSELETNILLLTDAIDKISKTEVIPTPTIEYTNNMQEAILGNNFALAQRISEDFIEYIQANRETNSVYVLLTKINNLILALQEKQALEAEERRVLEQREKELSEIEELADFIRSQNMSIDLAIKKNGLFHEHALLVKLIYARDCYKMLNYENGDKYLQEVELDNNKTPNVITLLEEVRVIRDEYLNKRKPYTRSLTQNQQ